MSESIISRVLYPESRMLGRVGRIMVTRALEGARVVSQGPGPGVVGWQQGARSLSQVQGQEAGQGQGLLISDSAAARLREIGGASGALRVVVEGGGCSGFQYKFEMEEEGELGEDDVMVVREGARVVVDQTSLDYLQGSTVDYKQELIRAAFMWVNLLISNNLLTPTNILTL